MSAERRNLPAVVDTSAPVKTSTTRSALAVPAVIAGAGDHAARRRTSGPCAPRHSERVIRRRPQGGSRGVPQKRPEILAHNLSSGLSLETRRPSIYFSTHVNGMGSTSVMDFAVGDCVVLKSGSDIMTTEKIEGHHVTCVWHYNHEHHRETYAAASLKKYIPSGPSSAIPTDRRR